MKMNGGCSSRDENRKISRLGWPHSGVLHRVLGDYLRECLFALPIEPSYMIFWRQGLPTYQGDG